MVGRAPARALIYQSGRRLDRLRVGTRFYIARTVPNIEIDDPRDEFFKETSF